MVEVCKKLEIDVSNSSRENQFKKLSQYLDELIQTDFNKLINILYRIDVSEDKAKRALVNKKDSQSNGDVLAYLIIERETEKLKWRNKYNSKS